jgi:hypothetical protein
MSFTLLTCPATMGRSFHLSFRTSQHKGHPHPVLSRSTKGVSALITADSLSTELEARLHLALKPFKAKADFLSIDLSGGAGRQTLTHDPHTWYVGADARTTGLPRLNRRTLAPPTCRRLPPDLKAFLAAPGCRSSSRCPLPTLLSRPAQSDCPLAADTLGGRVLREGVITPTTGPLSRRVHA